MKGLLRYFLLDQNTPILHHTETNCPHSFSITVACSEKPATTSTANPALVSQIGCACYSGCVNISNSWVPKVFFFKWDG